MEFILIFLAIGIAQIVYEYYEENYGRPQAIKETKKAIRDLKSSPKAYEIEQAKIYAQIEADEAEANEPHSNARANYVMNKD